MASFLLSPSSFWLFDMPSTNAELVFALPNTWKRILPISVVATGYNPPNWLLIATMVVKPNG
ncbi:hypothetical protein PAAG_12491 [Paracoccidioides lutzii Pb01]|uniref:Uncharacterized protein n=1 Tax=Paracoccidioides lutzii (strain ATCC MYA-826 / Pb01) TaxID=502779 RepID=A0A0A2UZ28_PARBA|nr:hypothetical protein PAAG_12491 [Paracoccidioides lutzii Pb01]KGQ00826.1 hypothetical protein PAAG_12491 [Paracoccidioides lutzii Pb01]